MATHYVANCDIKKPLLKSCDASQLFEKAIFGCNLGTPVLKPYKLRNKTVSADTLTDFLVKGIGIDTAFWNE